MKAVPAYLQSMIPAEVCSLIYRKTVLSFIDELIRWLILLLT